MQDNFYNETGDAFEVSGNTPFFLNHSSSIWYISRGSIDLFAVTMAGEKPVGPRQFLFRVDQTHLFFGLGLKESSEEVGILAVGTAGSKVRCFDRQTMRKMLADPYLNRKSLREVEIWLARFPGCIQQKRAPRDTIVLENNQSLDVKSGDCLRAGKTLLWVEMPDNSGSFMGYLDVSSKDGIVCLPLPAAGWIAFSRECNICAAAQMPEIPGLFKCIDNFHNLILMGIQTSITAKNNQETMRLEKRAKSRINAFQESLSGIASVLGKAEITKPVQDQDNLLSACRKIGQKAGIDFVAPSSGPEDKMIRLHAIAKASRVRMRKVLLENRWWKNDNGPLLGFIGEERLPVALLPISPGKYECFDPAALSSEFVTLDVAKSLDLFAYTFYRPFPEHSLKGMEILKFAASGCVKDMVHLVMIGLFTGVLGLIAPFATGIVFDSVLPEAAAGRLMQVMMILLVAAFSVAMLEVAKGIALLRVECRMDASLQSAVMDRLMSLPAGFFRNYTSGDLSERTLGIGKIRELASGTTAQGILAGIFSLINFFLMVWYSKKLALLAMLIGLAGFGVIGGIGFVKVKNERKLAWMQGRISGMVLQFVTGISKLRISGNENRAFSVWADMFREQKTTAFTSGTLENILAVYNAAFPVVAMMILFVQAASFDSSVLSTGSFIGFMAAYTVFQNSLIQMVAALLTILNCIPLYERAKPLLETTPESGRDKTFPGDLAGHIDVRHVRFRYRSDGPLILKEVSFEAMPGEFIALVGGSGSGKSTLFRILMGFEEPESGTVYYDGHDLSLLDISDVRQQVGIVLQNGKIMPGTVMDNIIGASNLTLEDAWKAAEMSGLEEDIKAMPMGMHTVLSAGGGTLSGGQKQRLIIARAIVRKPRILFFDEATSALDNHTQAIVSRSLEKLSATRIVIAHRLSTIINADRILVLDRGRITQSGTYTELMEQDGLFADLARRQIA